MGNQVAAKHSPLIDSSLIAVDGVMDEWQYEQRFIFVHPSYVRFGYE
jgi:hypothetical protein